METHYWHSACSETHILRSVVKKSESILATPLQPVPEPPQASAMYLVRLRSHLARGRVAVGNALDAMSEVLPQSPWSNRDR